MHDKAHKTQIRQAVEELFDVKVVERPHRLGQEQAQAPRPDLGPHPPVEEGDRPGREGDTIPIFQASRQPSNGHPQAQADLPGRRFVTYPDFAEITRTKPEKSLTEGLKKSGGRNANGRKTSRHRGGGAKRLYRKVDFKRRKDGIPAKVAQIEYDPNRSAYIALLHYADGEKAYILAPQRLRVGATVQSGADADIRVGNALPLASMPPGTVVHNVELTPAAAARWRARRGPACSCWPKRASTSPCACPPER